MKYLFGDSTEFPLQRDFLGLMDNFINTSVKAITLENMVFSLKDDIKDKHRLRNSVLDGMDGFLITIENAISDAVARSKEQETILIYSEKSKEFLKKLIEEGKTKSSDEIFKKIKELEKKINEADEENRITLGFFFISDPIPIINKKFTLKATEEGYSTKVQVDYEGEISCVFEIGLSKIPFWDGHVKAIDFVKGVEIPARMKKPFLKKELVPDMVIMDNYLLCDLVFSGEELEVAFRKRLDTSSERFGLKMNFGNEFTIEVYHAEENEVEQNIQDVPELKSALNIFRLRELGERIVEQTNTLYSNKHRLESIYLSSKDVLEENLIFELMQKVAEILAPAVAELKKRSPAEEELSLKAEDETGIRNEIYLKKSTIKEKFSAIKEKGDRLFEILDVL